MMRDYVKEKVLARGKKVSIGIDVHKESWQVTVSSEGEELFNGRMPGDYLALRKCSIGLSIVRYGWLTRQDPAALGCMTG